MEDPSCNDRIALESYGTKLFYTHDAFLSVQALSAQALGMIGCCNPTDCRSSQLLNSPRPVIRIEHSKCWCSDCWTQSPSREVNHTSRKNSFRSIDRIGTDQIAETKWQMTSILVAMKKDRLRGSMSKFKRLNRDERSVEALSIPRLITD
jgi:hypothetical protein